MPGKEVHNHYYHQTMFILQGEFECWEFDPQTDEIVEKAVCPAGTSIYVSSTAPHGMKNIGQEPATFLCCIFNVYDEDEKL